jgi:RNA polymerase sigma factor (sigma-70 family)
MTEDTELLRRYAQQASQEAFAELVRRHIDLVYATALRRTNGQHALAEEATQQAFISLARHAETLTRHPTVAGWLYVTARHAAATLTRSEQSRQSREQEAFMNPPHPTEPAGNGETLRPELDHLIEHLEAGERDAVVLRFFEGRKYAEIGATLRVSEDAARMRIERALEKLRRLLARRGVTSTAAALAMELVHASALAAPAGLAKTVTLAALAGAGGGAGAVAGLFTLMNATKLALGALGLLLLLETGFLVLQHRTQTDLRQEVARLREAVEQARQTALARTDSGAPKSGGRAIETAAIGPNPPPVKATRPAPEAAPAASPPGMVRAETWQDRGTATPAAALETYLWGGDRVDLDARTRTLGFGELKPQVAEFFARLSPEIRARYDSPEKLWATVIAGAPQAARVLAFEVTAQTPDPAQGTATVTLHVRTQKEGGITDEGDMTFERSPDGWRRTLPANLIMPVFDLFPSAKPPAAGSK